MTYGNRIALDRPFGEALDEVRGALKDQGFGVLTEIDVQATMAEKLGAAIEPYVILGACNPPLAHRALAADPAIGLLLPCNVVVRTAGTQTIVEAIDPALLVELTGNASLRPVANEASERLVAALTTLQAA